MALRAARGVALRAARGGFAAKHAGGRSQLERDAARGRGQLHALQAGPTPGAKTESFEAEAGFAFGDELDVGGAFEALFDFAGFDG